MRSFAVSHFKSHFSLYIVSNPLRLLLLLILLLLLLSLCCSLFVDILFLFLFLLVFPCVFVASENSVFIICEIENIYIYKNVLLAVVRICVSLNATTNAISQTI